MPVAVEHDVDDLAEQQRYDDAGCRGQPVSSSAAQASRLNISTWCHSLAAARRPVAIGRGAVRSVYVADVRVSAHRSTAAA